MANTPPQAQQPSTPAMSARDRAIQKLTAAPEPTPVQNQNNIQPEEMSAIMPKVDDSRQQGELEAKIDDQKPPVEEPQKPAEDPAITKRFAQLAKQEQTLRAREQALKAREQALDTQKPPQQPQIDPNKYITRDQLKQNALQYLSEAGVSYEELTNQLLNQSPIDHRTESMISELKAEIQSLRQANEESKKSYEEQQNNAYQAAVKQIESDVKHLVSKDDTYEAIKSSNAHKDVVELITETYHKDGILLSIEEAAQQVEDFLVEQYTKYTNLNKIKQRMSQSNASKAQTPSVKPPTEETQQPKSPQKTLTNNMSSSRPLTARERAILAFKGEKIG